MQSPHTRALNHFLQWKEDLSLLITELKQYPSDVDAPLITLQRHRMENILERFLNGVVDATEVETWANAIEGNDAIAMEPDHEDWLNETIFILANPLLTEPLALESAEKIFLSIPQ